MGPKSAQIRCSKNKVFKWLTLSYIFVNSTHKQQFLRHHKVCITRYASQGTSTHVNLPQGRHLQSSQTPHCFRALSTASELSALLWQPTGHVPSLRETNRWLPASPHAPGSSSAPARGLRQTSAAAQPRNVSALSYNEGGYLLL